MYTNKAIKLKTDLNLGNYSLKKSLLNLGYFLSLKNDIYNSNKAYLKVIELEPEDIFSQDSNLELGYNYAITGDFEKALSHLENLNRYFELDTVNIKHQVHANYFMADIYSLMDYVDYEHQIKFHLNISDSLIKKSKKDFSFTKIAIIQMKGNLALKLNHYNESLSLNFEVLENSENILSNEEKSIVNNSIGASYLGLEDFKKAKYFIERAYRLDPNNSEVYENFGDCFLEIKNYEKAFINYQKAINCAIGRKDFKNSTKITNDELELTLEKTALLNHLIAKAKAELKYYYNSKEAIYLQYALRGFKTSDALITIINAQSSEYKSKLFWRKQSSELYAKAVEVCFLLDNIEDAFYFMERNKSMLLLENMSHEKAKKLSNLPDKIASKDFKLNRKIFLLENELKQNSSAKIKDSIFKAKYEYLKFQDSVNSVFPKYGQLKRNFDVISYENFKANYCNKNSTILQYIIDEKGYGLISTASDSYFFEIPNISNLNNLIDIYRTSISKSQTSTKSLEKVSSDLFNMLIPEHIYKQIIGKELIIIPDNSLQQFPFEGLITDTGEYLIETCPVQYNYSISYLDSKKNIKSEASNNFIGFAPVTFTDLPPLSFSGKEIDNISAIYKGKIYKNEKATKINFLSNFNDFKIIHLSTHADVSEKENHWVAFKDEKLFIDEIYASKNNAEMIVLSACNTSFGKVQKGEGVMSLARSFFSSGAKSVISTLWSVDDKSTKTILVDFYKNLSDGHTKSVAMQKAKVDFINNYKNQSIDISPKFWAAPIVIGDNSPILNESRNSLMVTLLVCIIVLITAFYLIYFFYKRQG